MTAHVVVKEEERSPPMCEGKRKGKKSGDSGGLHLRRAYFDSELEQRLCS